MKMYVFPFNKVCYGDKILIYGAGNICNQYLSQMKALNYCNCISIIDKNYLELKSVAGIAVRPVEDIISLEYDKILIASVVHADEMISILMGHECPVSKIVRDIRSVDVIYISDYPYNTKHRISLRHSNIHELMQAWYVNNKDESLTLVKDFLSHEKRFCEISNHSQKPSMPFWNNEYIPPFDAITIYGFMAKKNPRYYVEVGSGNTTLFAAKAIRDNNLRTKIISIDPLPREECNALCHEIYRYALEDMDIDFFDKLTAEDILLIDSSHRAFPNSDVSVFFTEILPRLASGLIYTLHNIFIPCDYPETLSARGYNEQYLLCAYLLGGGSGDVIKMPNAYLSRQPEFVNICEPLWGKGKLFDEKVLGGGFLGLQKS